MKRRGPNLDDYILASAFGVHSREEAVRRWGAAAVVTGHGGVLLVDFNYLDPVRDLYRVEDGNEETGEDDAV